MRQLCDEATNNNTALDFVGRCCRVRRSCNLTVVPNPRGRYGDGTTFQVHDRERMEAVPDVWHGGFLV